MVRGSFIALFLIYQNEFCFENAAFKCENLHYIRILNEGAGNES